MTDTPATKPAECEVLRLAYEFRDAMNACEEAGEIERATHCRYATADGIALPIAAQSVSRHALDRAEHCLEAMSFATCSSIEGALVLLASANREMARAMDQMVPRYTNDGDLETGVEDPRHHRRRAQRMQAEAQRFLEYSGNNRLPAELLNWVGEFTGAGLTLHTPAGLDAVRAAAKAAEGAPADQAA